MENTRKTAGLTGGCCVIIRTEMTYIDLHRKLHDHPFKPFRIRMTNSTIYDILEPWMVTVGDSSALIVTQVREDDRGVKIAADWKTVSISHMMEFSDLHVKRNGTKKK
jgi:hypothetical protein